MEVLRRGTPYGSPGTPFINNTCTIGVWSLSNNKKVEMSFFIIYTEN